MPLTTQLLCHVQIFIVITSLQFDESRKKFPSQLWKEKHQQNGRKVVIIGLKYHYWHWLTCFVIKTVPTQVCVWALIRFSSDFYLDGSKPNVHLMMSKKSFIFMKSQWGNQNLKWCWKYQRGPISISTISLSTCVHHNCQVKYSVITNAAQSKGWPDNGLKL